jgi:hypothetical protein
MVVNITINFLILMAAFWLHRSTHCFFCRKYTVKYSSILGHQTGNLFSDSSEKRKDVFLYFSFSIDLRWFEEKIYIYIKIHI